MIQVKSPLSNKHNTTVEAEILVKSIIENYKQDCGIDVSEYFKGLSYIHIYKCLDSNYKFYFPFHISGKDSLYEKLQKNNGYYQLRLEHKIAESFFKADSSILEIGCGNGFFLEELQRTRKILCTGLEFNQDAVRAGQSKGLNILAEDISNYSTQHYEEYDIVCSFQVLEHVVEVHDFIQAALDSLKVGGKFIIGVPNNNPYLYKYDMYHTLNLPPHHMGLWDVDSLDNLQDIFRIEVDRILVEPLQVHDYEYFLKLQSKHSGLFLRLISKIILNMMPYIIRGKIQDIFSNFYQGRNILAIYTKI